MTLYTEKEAAEKWCPLARVFENGGTCPTSHNRVQWNDRANKDVALPIAAYCIGSKCMAWRKAAGDFDEFGNLPGYCGAFGKVEP